MEFVRKGGDRKRLISNFLSLSVLQATLYILPLITLPYLVRTLGAEKYGMLMFSYSLSQYFLFLVDYGFYLSGTRLIAVNRDDPEKLADIVADITAARIIMFLLSCLILLLLVGFIPPFTEDRPLHLLTFLMVFGHLLFPVWFFQGIERMEFITIVNLISRLLFTVLIFVMISSEKDYLWFPILNAAGFLLAGILSLYFMYGLFGLAYRPPTLTRGWMRLKENGYIFVTDFVPNLYNNSSTFILGLVAPPHVVAYFAAATKILNAVLQGIQVISRTFFPYLNRNFARFRLFAVGALSIGTVLSLLLALFSPLLSDLLFTPALAEVGRTLRYMSPSAFLMSVIVCFGTNYLLIKKEDRRYMKIMLWSSVTGFALALLLIPPYLHIGAAIVVVVSRGLIAVGAYFTAQRLEKCAGGGAL